MTEEVSPEKQRWNAYFWEPGGCLRNKLDIKNPIELHFAEYRLRAVRQGEIDRGEVDVPRTYDKAHLQAIHQHMFQDVYDWAGQFRDVGITKKGNPFVPAELLDKWTGKVAAKVNDKDWSTMSREEFVQGIAEVYSYQNLTHPFREGNGRISRLLADVMAVQAGGGPLDYSAWDADKAAYFRAIQTGMACDYEPMTRLVEKALERGEASP